MCMTWGFPWRWVTADFHRFCKWNCFCPWINVQGSAEAGVSPLLALLLWQNPILCGHDDRGVESWAEAVESFSFHRRSYSCLWRKPCQWLICYIWKCSIKIVLQPFPPKTAGLLGEQKLSLPGPCAKALQPWPWSCFHLQQLQMEQGDLQTAVVVLWWQWSSASVQAVFMLLCLSCCSKVLCLMKKA